MLTINPFAELTNAIPAYLLQFFVIAMVLLIIIGTGLDMLHKKNVVYFFRNALKEKKSAKTELSTGKKTAVILKKTGQVNIMVRDVQGIEDNPFNFETVKKNILEALKDYQGRIKVTLVPNLTNICYGRGVGYKIEEIVLDEKTQQISATKIREQMRKEGKLK